MTLKDAYRKTPAHEAEARGMLAMIREHNRQGLRGDPVMNTTNSRVAYLSGYLDAHRPEPTIRDRDDKLTVCPGCHAGHGCPPNLPCLDDGGKDR